MALSFSQWGSLPRSRTLTSPKRRRDAGATVAGDRRGRGFHGVSSSSRLSCRIASSASVTGDEITYAPLAHLPRSIRRQRSLQKGKSASSAFAGFLQIGQRSLMGRLLDILVIAETGLSPSSETRQAASLWENLNDVGNQVVIVRRRDTAAVKLSLFRLVSFGIIVHEDFAVNLRCVHRCAAFEQEVGLS